MSRHLSSRLTVAVAAVISLAVQASALTDATQFNAQSLNQGRPLFFTENKGQWDERVLFKADGAGGLTWFVERDGFTVLFSVPDTSAEPIVDPRSFGLPEEMQRFDAVDRYPNKAHALKFKFQNTLPRTASNFLPEQTSSATAASIESTERLSWNNNYFLGNDESKWAPDCGNYQRVVLKDIWNGVDVQWRGEGKHAEFDFLVAPGAEASQILVECLGLTGDLEATADGGELLLPTSLGVLRQALPEAFQIEPNGSLSAVRAEFKVNRGNSFGVVLPEGHDSDKPLIVDPIVYSTFLGDNGQDYSYGITSLDDGSVVLVGITTGSGFPVTEGAYQEEYGGNSYDGFLTKLSADGRTMLYSTYLGGNGDERLRAVKPDGEGGVVVVGCSTGSFPITEGAFQAEYAGGRLDAFVARLNADGNELIFSTYLGGGGVDYGQFIVQDGIGGVVVGGYTDSDDFPTTDGVFDRSYNGGDDVFLARMSGDGRRLLYGLYLGDTERDHMRGIAQDGNGGVVIGGYTTSPEFPTTEGVYDPSFNGGADGFVAVISEDGNSLRYCTFLGSENVESVMDVEVDEDRSIVASGYTMGGAFPITEGVFDESYNGGREDVFIIRLSEDCSEALFSTYLGGDSYDDLYCMALDSEGGVLLAGWTLSSNFPLTNEAFDRECDDAEGDGFLARLSGDGRSLWYGTYLGGRTEDRVESLTLEGGINPIVTGYTRSNDFPVTNGAYQANFGGGPEDAFIAKFNIRTGGLFGRVFDLSSGEPLDSALVMTNNGYSTHTDSEGNWRIERILSGLVNLTASKFGYNDSTLSELEVVAGEARQIDFSLRHPSIAVEAGQFNADLEQGETQEFTFTIANEGNGMLEWAGGLVPEGLENLGLLSRRDVFQAGQTVGDYRLNGVAFANNRFYLSGANGENPNQIYVLNRDGEQIGNFNQSGESLFGMKDLEWDGELLWGSGEQSVFGFTTDGEVMSQFDGPVDPNANIAWDSDRELLWISGVTTDISAYDRQGNRHDLTVARRGFRIYGLAYWADDPDNHPLYVLHCPTQSIQALAKINPEDNDTMFVAQFDVTGSPTGAAITADYSQYTIDLVTLANVSEPDGGDRIDVWILDCNSRWVELEPDSGEVVPGEQIDVSLTLNASGLREGLTYEGNLVLNHNGAGDAIQTPIALTVLGADWVSQRTLQMDIGWNLVSLNVRLEEDNFPQVVQPLVEAGVLRLAKDVSGNFYWPVRGFNRIARWDPSQGYWLNLSGQSELSVIGAFVAPDYPIALDEGWNIASYIPRQEVEVEIALSGIVDNLLIAKDGEGNFYLPAQQFSNMPALVEGHGYQLKVDADVELVYRTQARQRLASIVHSTSSYQRNECPKVAPTGRNMSLLVKAPSGLNYGIGVFSDARLVGNGWMENGVCGIAVWGDDPTTEMIDGAIEGEALTFKLWNEHIETPILLNWKEGKGVYHTDGFGFAEVSTPSVHPTEFSLSTPYPNPFNGTVRLSYGLPNAGHVRMSIFDVSGREVARLIDGSQVAGVHTIDWTADAHPSGIYLLNLENSGQTRRVKLTHLK